MRKANEVNRVTCLVMSLCFAAAGLAAVAGGQKARSGLWRFDAQPPVPPLATFQMCVGVAAKPQGPPKLASYCHEEKSQGSAGEEISVTVCRFGQLTTKTRSIKTYLSPTHFHVRTERIAENSASSVPGRLHADDLDATYLGPCPGGMRNGEMKLQDGRVLTPSNIQETMKALNAPTAP
jgi:hypothetical protein